MDFISRLLNAAKQGVQQVIPGAQTLGNLAQVASQFPSQFNPVSQVQSVMQAPPWQAQQFRQQVQQTVPQFQTPAPIANIPFAGGVVKNLIQPLINTPSDAVVGMAQLPAARSLPQVLGNMAQISKLPLTLASGNVAQAGIGAAGLPALPATAPLTARILQGAVGGASAGAPFGFLQGLQQGANANDVQTQLKGTIKPTLTGAGAGAVGGAAIPIATAGIKGVTGLNQRGSVGDIGQPNPEDITAALQSGKITQAEAQALGKVGGLPPVMPPATTPPNEPGGVPNPQDPYFNVNRYNIPDQAKQELADTVVASRKPIEALTGQPMSNQSVIDFANQSSNVLNKTVGQDQTQAYTASLLKARQNLAAAAQTGTVDQNYIDNLLVVKSQATDIARKLQSFNITADPQQAAPQQAIVDAALKAGASADEVIKAADGVDFNNPQEAATFYRQFVKPNAADWIDLVRYNSMLSSPATLFRIGFGNAVNSAVVAPVTKTVAGAIDAITPGEQTHFIGEGPAYVKGYFGSMPDALQAAKDVLGGTKYGNVPDVNQLPLATEGAGGNAVSALTFPSKLHNAIYNFFGTMAQGGETNSLNYKIAQGADIAQQDIPDLAKAGADYSTYRQGLHPEGQGTVLDAIDNIAGIAKEAKNSNNPLTSWPAKFVFPFLNIANNQIKQGLEYTPAGFSTMAGAADPTLQAAKAVVGTTILTGAAAWVRQEANQGNVTWAAPTSQKAKQAFDAAGMQPYSVKIGGNWYGWDKLAPAVGIPLAIASAFNQAENNKTYNQGTANAVMGAINNVVAYQFNQSYMSNFGRALSAIQSSVQGGAGVPGQVTNAAAQYPQQIVPYRAFLGWLARVTDPYKRQVNPNANVLQKQAEALLQQIPFASQTLQPQTDALGQPVQNGSGNFNRLWNNTTPIPVKQANPLGEGIYNIYQQGLEQTRNLAAFKKTLAQGNPQLNMQGATVNATAPGTITGVAQSAKQLSPQEQQAKALIAYAATSGDPALMPKIPGMIQQLGGIPAGNGYMLGNSFFYANPTTGNVTAVSTNTAIPSPQLTGNPNLDAQLIKDYKTNLSGAMNNVATLQEQNAITATDAEQKLQSLQGQLDALKTTTAKGSSGGGRVATGTRGRKLSLRPRRVAAAKVSNLKLTQKAAPRITIKKLALAKPVKVAILHSHAPA